MTTTTARSDGIRSKNNNNNNNNSNVSAIQQDDPLDADGKHNNFLTGKPYTAARMEWAQKWSTFPMYSNKVKLRQFVHALDTVPVTVIVSGTGSGKTVCSPPIVLRHVLARSDNDVYPTSGNTTNGNATNGNTTNGSATSPHRPPRVAVTIPKRSTALSAAQRGAVTLDVELGVEVGYLYRGSPPGGFDKDKTRLVYATDGTILAQTWRDPLLSDYGALIIDEAHERPVPTDMLLLASLNVMRSRPEFRLVIMSATIDPTVFTSYFEAAGFPTKVVEISGEPMQPVKWIFASKVSVKPEDAVKRSVELVADKILILPPPHVPAPQSAAPQSAASQSAASQSAASQSAASQSAASQSAASQSATRIHSPRSPRHVHVSHKQDVIAYDGKNGGGIQADSGDVIVFHATTREAADGCRLLRKYCEVKGRTCHLDVTDCAGVYSKLGEEALTAAIAPVEYPFARKVLFATNVAESSLTMKGLRYVVDSGYELRSAWHPLDHSFALVKGYASRAQIMQRAGRVGRTAPGTVYTLYTKATFDKIPMYPSPAILNVDISEHVLSYVCSFGKGGVAKTVHQLKSLITPPTDDQIRGALAFLHFHRLLRLRESGVSGGDGLRGGERRLTYADVDYAGRKDVASSLDGEATALGVWVMRVTERLKMSIWNALLVCAGIAYGCAAEAGVLAAILDTTDGEMGSMWSTDDLKHTPVAKFVDKGSDHLSLLRIYSKLYVPLKEGQDSAKNAIREAGLSPGVWKAIHRKVKDIRRDVERFAAMSRRDKRAIDDNPFYRLRYFEETATSPPIMLALLASRMYHLARFMGADTKGGGGGKGRKGRDAGKGRDAVGKAGKAGKAGKGIKGGMVKTMRSVNTLSKVVANPEPALASRPRPDGGIRKEAGAIYEQLLSIDGVRRSFQVITWFDRIPNVRDV